MILTLKWPFGAKTNTKTAPMAMLQTPEQISISSSIQSNPAKAADAVKETTMATNKFIGFLEAAGKDFEKGLSWAVAEAPAVDKVLADFFPASVAVSAPATLGLNLLQNSILAIEQKYAASGAQGGTGTQKAAEVLTLSGPAATALLNQAGLPAADDSYVSDIVDLLVGALNLKTPPATSTAAVQAAKAA